MEIIIKERELNKLLELKKIIYFKNFIRNAKCISYKNNVLKEIDLTLETNQEILITELRKYNSDLLFTELHRKYVEYPKTYSESIIRHLYNIYKGDTFYSNVNGVNYTVTEVE